LYCSKPKLSSWLGLSTMFSAVQPRLPVEVHFLWSSSLTLAKKPDTTPVTGVEPQ
jgi:hypothetical protein